MPELLEKKEENGTHGPPQCRLCYTVPQIRHSGPEHVESAVHARFSASSSYVLMCIISHLDCDVVFAQIITRQLSLLFRIVRVPLISQLVANKFVIRHCLTSSFQFRTTCRLRHIHQTVRVRYIFFESHVVYV